MKKNAFLSYFIFSVEYVKQLERKLKLRLEDSVVFKSRIDEQDETIEALTKKKNELKGIIVLYKMVP